MEKIFYPDSLAIIGLSSKPLNIPRMMLENTLRWGFKGRIFGINPRSDDVHVDGIKMFKSVEDLPEVPDLAVSLIPARLIPDMVEECGKFGIKRIAIPTGGFGEFGEEGRRLSEQTLENARKYGVRIVGPNGLMVANTVNGLCLPFVPLLRPPVGGMSIITQSGGVGIMMWNLITEENLGMAKFASIGNKLDLDEVDFLEYFGNDPETKIICMYLEGISRGRDLIETARKIQKPIIVFKSNTTSIGKKAAMSHTDALSNDEDVINAAFESVGIIRIYNYNDFVAVSKAFQLPPMKGNRIMVMSPAGGFSVITADLCEEAGFEFADPGKEFYDGLQQFSNAGVISFSNPLDMGDIYDAKMSAHVLFSVMHNSNIDGAVYVSQRPKMPYGKNVFEGMFQTDLSKETWGAILSSGKPLGICLFGLSEMISQIKQNVNFPVFNTPEEMVRAMAIQRNFYSNERISPDERQALVPIHRDAAAEWLFSCDEITGEEALELLAITGVNVPKSVVATDEEDAVHAAASIGYPVVMKVVSPDALHKTDAGGVVVNVKTPEEVRESFRKIKENLETYKKGARFEGVRIQEMAADGYDMFIGGKYDQSFGPVVLFGFGGIFVEVFRDVDCCLCPAMPGEVQKKVERLKSYQILRGARGGAPCDVQGYLDAIVRISVLLGEFPAIKELDINPLRILSDGSGLVALDARMRVEKGEL